MKNVKLNIIIFCLFICALWLMSHNFNTIYLLSTFVCFLILFHKILNIKSKKIYTLTQISLFSSLATVCRCLFYLIPKFNPFLAIIILFSANMEKNCGFLIGLLSIFISNIFLGHGLWTPWQMVAAGTIGYLSGATFNNKIRPTPIRLALFSLICIIFVYSLIMDIYSILLINIINWQAVLIYFAISVLTNSLYAMASTIFIAILYNPITKLIRNTYKIVKR